MAKRTNVRSSSKRTADTADLDDSEESESRLEKKARLREELDFLQTRLRPKVAFRRPPSPPKIAFRKPPSTPSVQQYEDSQLSSAAQQLEQALHSSQSQLGDNKANPLVLEDDEGLDQDSGSEVGIDDQNNPLMLEDDEGPDKESDPTGATSVESEVDIDKQDNSITLEDEEGPEQNSESQIDITIPKQGQDQRISTPKGRQGQYGSVSHKEEWEIEKIVGKRRTSKGYEYKVRWRDTWLPGSEVENAMALMQRFEKEWLSRANRGR